MNITRKSAITGLERTKNIPVNPDDYIAWQSGLGSIHELMPYLTTADSEFILSGIVAEEWSIAFNSSETETC